MKLRDAVIVLRSKNAGVWHITIDMVFKNGELYRRAKSALNDELFKSIYHKENVRYFECDEINTIKVSFLRDKPAGSVDERDCLGAMLYVPLLEVDI